MTKQLRLRFWIALCCAVPALAGGVFIPFAGLEMDETLFAAPYFDRGTALFGIRLFHHRIPLMLMTYVGALKTLLYWPLFALFRSTFEHHPLLATWVVRLPMVLVGSLTVFVFFYFVQRAAGTRAAAIAIFLLAFDPTFILTNTFDWGPVAIEHLLLVSGCFFAIRYAQERVPRDVAFASIAFGLGLWNKAVFSWALAGLACACVLVFWNEIVKLTTSRVVLSAAACFLAAALPLILYNALNHFETFHSNAHLEPSAAPGKFVQVRLALQGSGLFAYVVGDDWYDNPKPPASALGRFAFWIRGTFGEHRSNGMDYAAGLALLAIPLWWRSRAARFSLIFMSVAWLLMASTKGAGTSQHHTVLLWPFPHLFIAIVLSSLRWRWLTAAICCILVASNLLVLNQYLMQFERNGADGNFTDAINSLSPILPTGRTIYLLDWGIQFPLDVLRNARLSMKPVNQFFTPDATIDQTRATIKTMAAEPDALFIAHAEKKENFEGVHKRFDEAAAAEGCRETSLKSVPDSNGRAVFQVFQLDCANNGR